VPVAVQDSTPPPPGRNRCLMLLTVPMHKTDRNQLCFAPTDRAAMVRVTLNNWLYRCVHVRQARTWWVLERMAESPHGVEYIFPTLLVSRRS
jgi:hypothetical protein